MNAHVARQHNHADWVFVVAPMQQFLRARLNSVRSLNPPASLRPRVKHLWKSDSDSNGVLWSNGGKRVRICKRREALTGTCWWNGSVDAQEADAASSLLIGIVGMEKVDLAAERPVALACQSAS